MAKISLKHTIFVLLGALLLLAVIFREALALQAIHAYLSYSCRHALHARFTIEKIYFDQGALVVEKPRIKTKREIKEGGFQLLADKLVVRASPNWSEHKLNMDVSLLDPAIDVRHAQADMRFWAKDSFKPLPFISVNAKLNIHGGTLAIHDFEAETPSKQTLYFKVEAEGGEQNRGSFVVSLDDPTLQSNCIVLSLARLEKRHIALDINFDDVKGAALVKALHNIVPGLDGLELSHGQVKGKMALTFPKEGRPFAQGELGFYDIAFALPELDLQGKVEEAHLHLTENPNYSKTEDQPDIPRTIGHLDITREGSLVFEGPSQPLCAFQHLKGVVYFQTQDGARVSVEGTCRHRGETARLNIDGEAHFAQEGRGSLDLSVRFASSNRQEASAHFVTRQLGSRFKFVEINVARVGPHEFDLIQTLFTPYLAGMHQVVMEDGIIDASALAYMRGLTITDLKIEKIAAQNLRLNIQPWKIGVSIDELSGELNINCAAANILETLNADLSAINGHIEFMGFDQTPCRLHNVHTQFAIRKGIVQKSLLLGELGGLQGSIAIDGTETNGEMIKAKFEGGALSLSTLLPEPMRQGLKSRFANDHLVVDLSAKPSPLGWLVEGTTVVQQPSINDDHRSEQKIEYGFDIELCSPQEWLLNVATKESETSWHDLGTAASLAAWAENASVSGMLQGFFLHEGWSRAHNLPLEKYLPLFFPYGQDIQIVGLGDFQGNFDHHGLVFHFGLKDLTIESPHYVIKIPKYDEDLPGKYRLDFSSGLWKSALSVQNGSYLEKNSGILFDVTKTEISCDGRTLHLNDLHAACEGLQWSGGLHLSFDPVFNISVEAKEAQGNFSHFQKLLAHFEKLKFVQKIPLEGQLQLGSKGLSLQMAFHPEGVKVDAKMDGELQEGAFPQQNSAVSFKNISLKFEFDHAKSRLDITDIAGNFALAKPGFKETQLPFGGSLRISNLSQGELDFDFKLGEAWDIAGKTRFDSDKIAVLFDPKRTHFATVQPEFLDLQLSKNWQIERFLLDIKIGLDKLLPDLNLISRSGLLPMPSEWQQKLESMATEGVVETKCAYHSQKGTLSWNISGQNLHFGDSSISTFLLEGKKRDNIWSIDQLIIDDFSLATNLERLPSNWKINFLGVRLKESLLLGLEGEYWDGSAVFDAKVNLLELNLGKLAEWPHLKSFVEKSKPSGHWKGSGQLRLEFSPAQSESESGWKLDTALNGNLRSWSLCGLQFQDASKVSCHYVSGQGIILRHLTTAIVAQEGAIAPLEIEKVAFDFTKGGLELDNIRFTIASEHAKQIANSFHEAFPALINEKTAAIISDLKQQGQLEGTLHLASSPAATLLNIDFQEGQYRFQGKDHPVHSLKVSYNLNELKVLAHYHLPSYSFWVQLATVDPKFASGNLLFSDSHPDEKPTQTPLKVEWEQHATEGWTIHKAEGHFSGLTLRLQRDTSLPFNGSIALNGDVSIDPTQAAALISEVAKAKIKTLNIGPGYILNGRWQILKNNAPTFFDQLQFTGKLEGNQIVFKGYLWQKLHGTVNWMPGYIQFRDLKIEDPCGLFAIDSIAVGRQDALWTFEMPRLRAENFRPSLMQEAGAPPNLVSKPLLMKNLDIENLTGYLHDSNTWKGKGKFYFVNPPKRHLQNTIFAIPAELLTLIGLDIAALNPVSGTVLYEIRDGRVILTKFKDVYSEGHLSKFYLSNPTKTPSYMDFEGNLAVQIRMKQYNLFFKLAELFIVNIKGPISKPVYSLQSQRRDTSKK